MLPRTPECTADPGESSDIIPLQSQATHSHLCIRQALFPGQGTSRWERPFSSLGNSSGNTDVLSFYAQQLDNCLDVFRPVFQDYSWWREVLSHPSGWMVWNALGGSVLAG